MVNNERGRTTRVRDEREEVITAGEMRDEGTRGVVAERPVAPQRPAAPPPRRNSGGMGWLWGLLALAAAIIIGLILWSLFSEDDRIPDTGASIEEITSDPARYYGQTVTVGGEIENIVGRRAFTVGGESFLGDPELLVVGASPLPAVAGRPADAGLAENDLVTVTGPVRRFVVADVEREIGFDLDDNLFRDWEGKPAVVARNVNLSPFRAQPAQGAGPGPALGVGPLLETPDRYFGQPVTVNGRVTRVVGPNAVVLDNRLLVTARNLPNNLQVGAPLRVTGPFNRFALPTFERDLGVDLNDQLFGEFNNQPAIAATNVVAAP